MSTHLHLHFVRFGICYDVDFQEEEISAEREAVVIEGKRYILRGDELAIKEIRNLLPDLGKKEMSVLSIKARLERMQAAEISLKPVSKSDVLAKQVGAEFFEPLKEAMQDSFKWLTTQYDEMISIFVPPPPIIPLSLPEVDILEVLKNPHYAKYPYAIHNGFLYLTDGKTGRFEVNLFKNSDPDTAQRFIELINPLNINQHSTTSLHQAVENLAQQSVDSENKKFSSNFFYKAYSQSYGIPNPLIKKALTVSNLLELSDTLKKVVELCKGPLQPYGLMRDLIAQVLKTQEEELLAQLPPEVLTDPMHTRYYLTTLLAEKGLTYEIAVAHYDRRLNETIEDSEEGSYVIVKLIAQIDAWATLQSKAQAKGEGAIFFPFQEIWRFFIDGDKENKGSYFFENEPFYMLSSLRGFKKILESQQPLGMETYEGYASALTEDPTVMKKWQGLVNMPEFFNTKPAEKLQGFDPSKMKSDSVGITDLVERSLARQKGETRGKEEEEGISPGVYWIANATGFDYQKFWLASRTNSSHKIIFQRIFLGLEQMLRNATTPGQRLIAYIWAARELEITHQMEDANGRASITSLIKWIADDPQLPIYMPEDPNILDLQGPEALIKEVYSGMRRFQTLCGKDPNSIMSLDILLNQAGVRDQAWAAVHQRAQLPDAMIAKLVADDLILNSD